MEARVERVAAHLRAELQEQDGPLYVKSRFLADDFDDSAQQIGTAMGLLADRDGGLTVERWGKSGGGVTWRVSER
jgi:hypothetical protein